MALLSALFRRVSHLKKVKMSLSLNNKRVVLFLQGGGALGAYQVGAFTALAEACKSVNNTVSWVGGISIGAVNSAVIAGAKSGDPVAELKQVWNEILDPPVDFITLWERLPPYFTFSSLSSLIPKYADFFSTAFNPFGKPHFWTSRLYNPLEDPLILQWFRPLKASELSFYDTEPLRQMLNKHVDFDSINSKGGTWLSLGATRVIDGELVFFNSFIEPISAQHVLASGALPPGFPGITVDGEVYWDGGVAGDTPIQSLAEYVVNDPKDTIVFLINLWDRKGTVPQSMDEMAWREKCIQFSSPKKVLASVVNEHQYKVELRKVAPMLLEVCPITFERSKNSQTGQTVQFAYADADFSRTTYEQMVKLGYADMQDLLEHPCRVPDVDA